jgi:hypothetical protein
MVDDMKVTEEADKQPFVVDRKKGLKLKTSTPELRTFS